MFTDDATSTIDDVRGTLFHESCTKLCDVCLAEDNAKNRVLEYNGPDDASFTAVEIHVEHREGGEARQGTFKPFQDAKERARRDSAGSRTVRICRHCLRQMKVVCFPTKRLRKNVAKFGTYIWNRLVANKSGRDEEERQDAVTITSNKCYLHGQTTFETSCSAPTRDLSCPLYLQSRMSDSWKIEQWITAFSKKMGIGTSVTEDIVKHADSVKLCQRHYGAMRNTMMVIEANASCCSICENTGDKRYVGEVTNFPFEELKKHQDIISVVEDSLSVLTDNKLQPQDVKNICSPCRLVVLGRVSMSPQGLRLKTNETKGFDYGPTEGLVLRCIQYVRTQLREEKKMFVKLKDVHDYYLELVRISGSYEVQQLAHKDIRTLRKYLQPPLSQTDIHLELGAKKVGSFFCTLETFKHIASTANKPKTSDYRKNPVEDKKNIDLLARFLRSRKEEVDRGDWNIVDYIRAVPKDLWGYDVSVFINKSLAARYSAVAKLRGVDVKEEWPYNPQECPANMNELPQREFAFTLSMYFSMERRAFLHTEKQVRGPMFTSMSITAMTDSTKAFMSYLNRISCMTSYQTVASIRRNSIAKRAQDGPFGDVVPTAFHSMAFDNINVRTLNSLDVHGKSTHGFDGFASQLVDANTGFDFAGLCKGRRKEDLEPRKLEDVDRDEFIKEMCPDQDDPNLNVYNYVAAALALKNKSKITSSDPKQQCSFRNILLNSFKGFTGGKAKVVYVTVDRSSAQDEITIVRELRKIEKHFKRLSEESGIHLVLAIVGDQPVFKMLFRLFYESYLTGSSLCKWMVPIPGGFHIEKQGIIPTVKEYLAGSGLEELAPFTGMSRKHQENIIKFGNYRKNRRFLLQVLSSMLLRIEDVCREEGGTEFSNALEKLIRADIESEVKRARGQETEDDRKRRAAKLKDLLPEGCKLQLSDSVSPELIEAGKLVCDKIKSISEHSLNMKFFGQCGLLNCL